MHVGIYASGKMMNKKYLFIIIRVIILYIILLLNFIFTLEP